MSKIYGHLLDGPDEVVGEIEPVHGYVYSDHFGPDQFVMQIVRKKM